MIVWTPLPERTSVNINTAKEHDITLTLTDEEACLLLQILSEEIDANDHLIETYNRMYKTAEEPKHIKSEQEAVIHDRKLVKVIADKVHSLIGGEAS